MQYIFRGFYKAIKKNTEHTGGKKMARTTLGLDLGIASIGWALIREDCHKRDLVDWGSRVFEPGMDDDIASGKGVSRCAKRRQQRALRTQYARRKERKENLLDVFVSIGLLKTKPNEDFFVEVDQRMLHKLPVEHRTRMAHLIPYLYRKLALDNLLQPDELARAIYHLAQRRGYKSNRKQELKSADTGVVKSTISQLKEKIRKAGARTLGEYFCTVDPENQRIRGENHFTERKMFQEEFHKICLAQRHLISEKQKKSFTRQYSISAR